jgi:hypothetical protein
LAEFKSFVEALVGKEITEADLKKLEWFVEHIEKLGICNQCVHCRTIDVERNVDCDMLLGGKMKVYCRNFKPKEKPKPEKPKEEK